MKLQIFNVIVLVVLGFQCGCRPSSNPTVQAETPAKAPQEKRVLEKEDLAKLIRTGMSKEDVFKTFGEPTLEPMSVEGGMTCFDYLFAVDECQFALKITHQFAGENHPPLR